MSRRKHSRLTEGQRQLCEQWSGLIAFVVNKYRTFWSRLEHDEAMSLAANALVRAASLFDPNFGVKFNTYAVRCILNSLRRENRLSGVVRSPSSGPNAGKLITCETLKDVDMASRIEKHEDGIIKDEIAEAVQIAIQNLRPKLQQVIILRMAGETLNEIARKMNLSKERVRQIENEAKAILRESLAGLQNAYMIAI